MTKNAVERAMEQPALVPGAKDAEAQRDLGTERLVVPALSAAFRERLTWEEGDVEILYEMELDSELREAILPSVY